MPISFDEWKKSQDKRSSVGSAITGAVGGKPGGQSGGGSVSGSIVGAVQQQPTGQSGQSGGTMSFTEWQQQQEQSSGGSSGTVGGSILGGLGVQGGSQQPVTQGDLAAGQKLYEQRKQAQANADPWTPTLKWLGGIAQQAEQARNGLQVDPTETYSAWEDVKDAWEASRTANRAADYAGRDKLIKEYIAARHEMGAQRHTPEPEVQRRYEQARDRLYEQERIHGNIGLNANGELQTMSYSFGEGVGNVIGGVMGRVIGGVGGAATWLGEAAARSGYAKSAAQQRELAAFYAMTGNDNASEGASRMADTLTQRAAQRGNLAEFGGAYSFFDKQAAAGNRLVQAAKENQRPVVQMGVDVGSTALEMGFDAVSGSPLVSMGVRVFGGASQEAREAGAGFLQQGAYGAASASIEVMTEMIGGLKLYGGGQLDEVLEPALREIAGTPGGYALLRALYTMAQEGNEEVLSDLLQPLAQSIYNGQSVGENYSELQLKDILYDWLLGAASAFGGAVVESGGYAQDYTAMREMQQDLNAQGVETGRMTDEQLRQAYTLDKAGVNVAGLQSAENRAVGGETIGEAYDNMTQEQRVAALVNMLTAQTQRSGQTQTPTDNITRETAQEILRESLGEREAESAERILDLGSESNLREQAIAYHTIATEYGQTEGRSVEDALRSNVRGALNDTQVQHAYAYGESLRKSGQTVGVNGQITEQGAQTAKPVRRAGLVTAGTFADGSTTYKAADLSKADARELTILKDIAKAQGVDFVLYESELGEADAEGRRSYIGANGAYRNGVVYLDINAGLSGERTEGGKTYSIGQRALLVTAAHELTHHLEHSNPTMYRQLRSFVTERLGGSDSFIGYVKDAMAREDISVEAASREVVARACEEVLLDEDAIREMQGKKPTLWEQIKEWVKDFVKKFESASGEAVEMRQYANELRRLWLDTALETPTDLRGDIVPANAPAVDPANAPEETFTASGANGQQYSLRSMSHDIAEGKMFSDLRQYCGWTQEQTDTLKKNLQGLVQYMSQYAGIVDMNESYDKGNRPYSAYKPNSDPLYTISLDFSTLCRKRLLTQHIMEQLQLQLIDAKSGKQGRILTAEEQMAIRDMLEDYAKQEKALKVACAMCYVEAARLKAPAQMERIIGDMGSVMIDYYAKQSDIFKGQTRSAQNRWKVEHGYSATDTKAAMTNKDRSAFNKFSKEFRESYTPTAAEMEVVERARNLPRTAFLSAENLTRLYTDEQTRDIYKAYTNKLRESTHSKGLETDIPYYYGDSAEAVSDTFIRNVVRENGMRFSSWSDFQMKHVLDMMTAVIELSTRKCSMHGYTKFLEAVRLFGRTGMMFNMSGVPAGNGFTEDGQLAFSKTESVLVYGENGEYDAIRARREFPETAGLQCIGISRAHILALLDSDIIDYIIPYHTSGLNAKLRKMAGINNWDDFQGFQQATVDKSIEQGNCPNDIWHKEPVFSEFFAAAKDPANGYKEGEAGIDTMRRAAEQYKQMCRERGLRPKFSWANSKVDANFADHPDYWKLLIDRKMINQETGKLIEQKPVEPNFDFAEIRRAVKEEVDSYDPSLEQRALNYVKEHLDELPGRVKELKAKGSQNAHEAQRPTTLDRHVMDMSNGLYAAEASGLRNPTVTGNDVQRSARGSWNSLSEEEKKLAIQENRAFNQSQTETGAPLVTLKGSPISRGGTLMGVRYPIGKVIGGRLYIHKSYADAIGDIDPNFRETLANAEDLLQAEYPDFEYNCLNYHPASGEIQFQEAPDFDTAREPVVGMQINVQADGTVTEANRGKPFQQIWHHKWQWVDNGYKGFKGSSVRQSWEWSKEWLSTILGASKGGSMRAWNEQLAENGLPKDTAAQETAQMSVRSDVTQGLNFRDASGELLERVFDGVKKYETRAYTDGKTNGQLPGTYLNKPMGIIQTGSGKAKLVGYWELGNGVLRDSKWLSEHRAELGNDGTEFEATPGEKKWVYPIKWAERTDPVEVTSYGIRARDISDIALGSKNAAPEAAYTGEITQYSLRGVEPVEPKSDAWKRGFTAEEVRRKYAGFRKSDAKNEYVEDSGKSYKERKADRIRLAQREKAGKRGNGTQRANTAPTYDRLYDTLEYEGFKGTILDASSGLGIGTDHGIQRGFDVEDIEPFYGEGYRPIFSDYSRLNKQYDVVISSAVINVLTQDDSDAMVAAIGNALKPGGRAFITVRSASSVDGSLKGGESKRLSQNAHEWVVPGSDNYQRGFETDELRAYLEDVLGPGFTVESSPKFYDKATDKWQKWGDTSAIVTRINAAPAMQRSAQAAEAEQQTGTDTTQRSVRDREYSDAVARGDMETAQQMVDEAAKAAGYTVKAFHGTRSFGFTVFDPSRADDGISLFATSNRRTAETYSGETNRDRIKDREAKNADDLHGEQLIEEAKNHKKRYQDYSLMSDKDKATVRDGAKSSIEWSIRRAQEFVRDHRDAFDSEKTYIMDRLISSLYHLRDSETEEDISGAWTEWEDALWDLKGMDDSIAVEFLEDVDSRGLFQSKNELDDMTYQGDMYADWYAGGPDYIFDNQLQIELNAEYHKGIYELWCKPGRQLLIDSNGENWNQITPPKELQDYGLYGPQRTRNIATAAKALGYDSVLLRDLRDNGGETAYNGLSDVYIFFDASALKSADPVTYDDNGEVIPLSQRFDSGRDDIRFSVRDNLGYHAGDLGKAEHLRIQGRSRGTGHFGTGTYFVGEAEKVTKDSHYGKRPQHAVDFSDYHLFRVRNDREGYRLHDALRIIDGGVRREWIAPAANHEFNAIDPTGYYKLAQEKYGDNWTRGDNLLNSMLEFAEQNGIKLKTLEEYQAENKTEGDEEDQKFWYQEYVKDTLSKEIKKVNDEYHELMDTFFNLELAFGFKSGKIEAALEAVADYQDATPRDAKADSYATVFMKAMGYEGVDVRGTGLDNTAYGSVIYDVRPETVEYSQREADAMTDREILMLADAYGEGQAELTEFRDAMARYQDYDEAAQEHLQKLGELQQERKTVTDMRTSTGEITPQEKQQRLDALDKQIASERREADKAEQNAARALDRVTQLEKGRALQDILVKERAAQRQRTRAQTNESTRRRDTRRKVEKLAKELQHRVLKPSEKRYIPADLMKQTVDVLQAINLDSSRPGTKSGEALRARLLEMQERYRTLETDETYKGASYDPTVAEMLKNMVQTVGDTPINKMTAAQLESVYNTLRAMTHVIQTGIKVKIAGEERDAWEVAHDMTRETRSVNKPKDSLISGWVNTQLSAQRMFRRLGNYTKNSAWEKVYRMLNDGQLKMTLIQMEGAQIFADLIGKENEKAYRELNSYKDKDLVDVGLTDVDGKSIKISHGMMVSLYMHLLNEQNARHVARGGLTIPDLKGYYTGADDRGFGSGERRAVGISAELAEARREQADAEDELREAKQSGDAEAIQQAEDAVDATKANVDDILAKGDAYLESLRESIEKQLTDYERKWIEATQELMDGYSKDRLNETTLEVYGIKKARVEHYFPIKSDRNFTRGDFEAVSRNMSLENVGFMKERVEGTNPMYLMDVADVVNTQISNVAQYCGLMPAIRSFNKIWNKSEAGNTVSLKDTVNQKFGQGGLKYVENLIADLQGARRGKSDSLSRFLSGMRGNMAGANLTISLNTALAQAASYPTAAAEIGWTPLIKAFFKGGQSGRMISRADRELIAKYTPLLWTRLQGYSTVELGDLAGNNQLAGRVFRKMRFITGWIQAMDTATVGRLWYAAQYYVDAKNPELQKGSDEYYKATAKIFNDIVEKTQPDYTTMQRPDILRNPNELVRSLTMFMTQRLQNFNIVYDSIATAQKYRQDYRNGLANGVTSEDVKQAQHEARRAVVSQIAAGATIVVFKTLSGILQHALDGYRDDDKELTEESISLACLDMFLDTMASNFLWGGELYDVIESAITGNRYYGLEVNGVQSISDILSTSQSLFSMLRDYKTLSWDKVQPKFITLAKKLGPALGLPIGNAVKLFKGVWLWGQEFIHAAEDGDLLKAFDFEEGVERGAGIEANRYVSAWLDGDRAKMREIIGGLGVSMTSFNSQLSSEIGDRYKDGSVNAAQAIRMLQELRGMTPEEAAKTVNEWKFKVDTGIEYDKIKEQLLNGSISVQRAAAYWQKYGGMSAEDATLKANYVAACGATPGLADKLSQTQYKGWYNNVRGAGVKVEVYAEIRSTASTDGNSNVSQAEAAAAITRAINARQLTPAQAQAVWQSFSSSWKTTYAEYIAQNK